MKTIQSTSMLGTYQQNPIWSTEDFKQMTSSWSTESLTGMKNAWSLGSLESASSEAPIHVFDNKVSWGGAKEDCDSYSYIMQPHERRITIAAILALFVLRFRPLWLVLKGTYALDIIVLTSNWID